MRNSWTHGWGIHRPPYGGRYPVSAWEAVEITLASGQHLRLGTDESQRRAQALRAIRRDR